MNLNLTVLLFHFLAQTSCFWEPLYNVEESWTHTHKWHAWECSNVYPLVGSRSQNTCNNWTGIVLKTMCTSSHVHLFMCARAVFMFLLYVDVSMSLLCFLFVSAASISVYMHVSIRPLSSTSSAYPVHCFRIDTKIEITSLQIVKLKCTLE